MKNKDLKLVIKQLVRESLTEIFAEIQLEKIVETVMEKQMKTLIKEVKPSVAHKVVSEPARRQSLLSQVMFNEEDQSSWYGKAQIKESVTAPAPNPYAEPDPISSQRREHVSEEALQQSGLLKDYSRFLK